MLSKDRLPIKADIVGFDRYQSRCKDRYNRIPHSDQTGKEHVRLRRHKTKPVLAESREDGSVQEDGQKSKSET